MPRAPLWRGDIGGEWLFRLSKEPGRLWHRYLLGNAIFLLHVLRESWRKRNKKSNKSDK